MSNTSLLKSPHLLRYLQQVGFQDSLPLQELRVFMNSHPHQHLMTDPHVSQFLAFLISLKKAQKILEVGTFVGYSTLSMALALPHNGHIITLDQDPEATNIARNFWEKNQVSQKISLHLGKALDSLATLQDQNAQFDLIYIDADKKLYEQYFEYALRLCTHEGVIAIDNTLWEGRVSEPSSSDPVTLALQLFNAKLHHDSRILSLILPIGDGLTLILKKKI